MPSSTPIVFTDQTSSSTGTPLNSARLNALVVASTYLVQGSTPGTGGTLTASTYGAQSAVIQNNAGTSVQFVSVAGGAIPALTASSDNYVDLSTSGSLTVSAVAINAAAPAQADSTIRLWKLTTGTTTVTAVTLLAGQSPIGANMLPASLTASAGLTVSGGGASITGATTIFGPDATTSGLVVWSATSAAIPNPGATTNTTNLTVRGLTVTNDSATISSGNQPTSGIGVAIARVGAALAVKNTVGTGLVVEAGGASITGATTIFGPDAATSGLVVWSATSAAIPNPGATTNTTNLTVRGLTITNDNATISSGNQPTSGLAVAVARVGAAMAIKNTVGTGLVVEAGGLTVSAGGLTVSSGTTTITPLLTAGGGITVSSGGLTVSAGGLTVSAGGLTISAGGATINGHVVSTGSSPSLTIGSGVNGSGAVIGFASSTNNTDRSGVISVTVGASPASAGQLCTVTFVTSYPLNAKVLLTPYSAGSAGLNLYAQPTPGTGSFSVGYVNAPTAGVTYTFAYFVDG